MTDTTTPRVDPRNYRLDGVFFRRIYTLAKPYWTRQGAWKSWVLLAYLVGMAGVYSALGAYFSFLTRDQTNALIAHHGDLYWRLLACVTAFAVFRALVFCSQAYVDTKLNLHWRKWLTTHLIDDYLARRTYYEITLDQVIDNPDQRIQEEVAPFCQTMSSLPRQVLTTVVDISVQAVILMSISKSLFFAVVGFAVFKTVVILRLWKPTIRQNYDITVAEADLRYGILHVRDHAETVAFYQGEYAERRHILARLGTTIQKNWINQLYASVWMGLVESGVGIIWTLLPVVFLAPLYLNHHIQYGSIVQGTAAAATVLSSLSIVMRFIPTLTLAVPKVIRLAEIQEKFEALGRARLSTAAVQRITFAEGKSIALDNVSLQTPGGEQTLVRNLRFSVAPHQNMVIVGRTGVGKSSLLRAMAGLWTRGSGHVVMPPQQETLFLPQKPYMILANLREQLLYPRRRPDRDDEELQAILERVLLHDLADKHGGLDARKDWARVLSLGEQQRIGFARVLVNKPKFIFLDEATSAVDIETEHLLYQLLVRSGAAYVSVGHRPSLLECHDIALQLFADGSWNMTPTARHGGGDDPRRGVEQMIEDIII